MATLYLTEQGATLRKEQRRLVIEKDGQILDEIHEFKVERVVIFGYIQITTQVIGDLLMRGVDTAFLNMQGQLKGRLAALASKNVPLRMRQYERVHDSAYSLEVARAMVKGKIANCSAVLARHQRNHPECDFRNDIDRLAGLMDEAVRKQSLDSLRGVEGHSAAVYFQCYGRMFRRHLRFDKRTRRPPVDPVNSMLSFGYSLMYNEAISALVAVGFEPYLGFYHGINYGRCSLALDLMEEFRHITIDRLVASLANLEVFKPEDFSKGDDGGVYLEGESRKRFLREYERLMLAEFIHGGTRERLSFRRSLHNQALALERSLLRGDPYEPFQGWR